MATRRKKKTTKRKTTKRKTTKRKATKRKTTKRKATKRKTTKRKTTKRKATKRKATKRKTTKRKTTKRKATKRKTTKRKTTKRKSTKKKATKRAATKKEAVRRGPVPPTRPTLTTPKNKGTKQYTQSELYDCIQSYCGFETRKEAKEFYEQFSGMLQSALKSGYRVMLPGLGKLQVRRTKARMGINPMTRERIRIKAKKRVRFTPNKALKEAVL